MAQETATHSTETHDTRAIRSWVAGTTASTSVACTGSVAFAGTES